MKRKTFVKCLMGMGISRNTANEICWKYINEYRKVRKDGIKLTWAIMLNSAMYYDFEFADKFHASREVFERYLEDNSQKLWKIYDREFYYNT